MSGRPTRRRVLGLCLLVCAVLWAVFILTRSLKPASVSSEESGRLLALLQGAFPWLTDHIIRKTAHFTEFFVLGGLLGGMFAALWRPMLWQPLLCGALIAAADETVQLFIEGRSGEVKDALLDTFGVLVAVLILFVLLRKSAPGRRSGRTKRAEGSKTEPSQRTE